MDDKIVQAIRKEAEKRKVGAKSSELIISDLFNKQRDFIQDHSRFKVAECTRRAGKTRTAASYMVTTCLENDDVICVYIALNRVRAKNLILPVIRKLNQKYNLKVEVSLSELSIQFQNGSVIRLIGANDEEACENLRGDPYKLVILDEAASYRRHIDYCINAIIEPCLLDHRGTLCLMGTPGPIWDGAFYKACHNKDDFKGYSVHRWSLHDNPFIGDTVTFLAEERVRKGISETNPVYMREYKGLWTRTDDFFVYRYTEENFVDIPAEVRDPNNKDMNYILGIDLGYDDASAFSVLGFSYGDPRVYVVDSTKKVGMLPHQVAEKARMLNQIYEPVSIVMDTGGLGKAIAEEIRVRYHLPIKPAEKSKKNEYIELLNSDLFEKKLLVSSHLTGLKAEWSEIQWDETKLFIPEGYEDHESDATLYAWRESRHFVYDPTKSKEENLGLTSNSDPDLERMLYQDERDRNASQLEDLWSTIVR